MKTTDRYYDGWVKYVSPYFTESTELKMDFYFHKKLNVDEIKKVCTNIIEHNYEDAIHSLKDTKKLIFNRYDEFIPFKEIENMDKEQVIEYLTNKENGEVYGEDGILTTDENVIRLINKSFSNENDKYFDIYFKE